MKKKETKPTNKPVHRVRNGAVSASVFLNETKEGVKFPSAVISRSYKTDDGFKETASFGRKHLTDLATVVANLKTWFDANYPEAAN